MYRTSSEVVAITQALLGPPKFRNDVVWNRNPPARDQATSATDWQRVSDHFHWLHDSPDSIVQLRQALLQLAVQGRLGTQDRKDEPAKKLIEQARSQWPERKVSERQNWKPEEPPCELPAGWEWTCLDVLGNTNPRNEADEKLEVAFTPMKFISAEYGRPAAPF